VLFFVPLIEVLLYSFDTRTNLASLPQHSTMGFLCLGAILQIPLATQCQLPLATQNPLPPSPCIPQATVEADITTLAAALSIPVMDFSRIIGSSD
jgi:hypothetical protein